MAQNTQFTLVAWIRQLSLGDPPPGLMPADPSW